MTLMDHIGLGLILIIVMYALALFGTETYPWYVLLFSIGTAFLWVEVIC